jgi:hypothetical protein
VVETGNLQARYARLADWFKAMGSFHHFATAVYKALLHEPVPYAVDSRRLQADLKLAGRSLIGEDAAQSLALIEECEREMQTAMHEILRADESIAPSAVRRFFEGLNQEDATIPAQLIRFYIAADAVDGDRRDKIDLLFTRMSEEFVDSSGEYRMRDALELRSEFFSIVGTRGILGQQAEVVRLIMLLQNMRDEMQHVVAFEELTRKNLLPHARLLKHQMGNLYLNPDVLLAVVDLNITAKNRFRTLYPEEERQVVADAARLVACEDSIRANFGQSNPELVRGIERFRQVKQRFDEARASSNVKHEVLTTLKASMRDVMTELDRALGGDDEELVPDNFFLQARQSDAVAEKFGDDPLLHPYLMGIAGLLEQAGPGRSPERIANSRIGRLVRLEPWEIAAYQKLYGLLAKLPEETDEILLLMVRSASMRLKIAEEATALAGMAEGASVDGALLEKARLSLERSTELDDLFGDLLQESICYSDPRIRRQLYRSRFRLLRAFSGLWLIYDQRTAGIEPVGHA